MNSPRKNGINEIKNNHINKFQCAASDKLNLNKDINCKCAKILVVDDEPFNILCIQKMLDNLDLKIDKANNGIEAFEKVVKKYNSK
jgi:PleD family two-component response regulator